MTAPMCPTVVKPAARPPQVARVSVATLRALRRALRGVEPAEVERLDAELEHLIAVAMERAWRL